MPTTLSITFHGLCFFAHRGARQTDALCHPEKGAHIPVLSIPVRQIEINANEWQPNFVTHDPSGEEIGVWSLVDQAFELGVDQNDRRWVGDVRGFRMREFHPESRTVSEEVADKVLFHTEGQGARIRLNGGVFRFDENPQIRVRIRQQMVQRAAADYSSAIHWRGELDDPKSGSILLPVNRKGQSIRLRRNDRVGMQITNVATVAAPDGLTHFECYYDFLENVPVEDRIVLYAAQMDADVFDCVPPTDD